MIVVEFPFRDRSFALYFGASGSHAPVTGLAERAARLGMNDVQIESVTSGRTLGSVGPLGVLVWTDVATEEGTAAFDTLLDGLGTRHDRIGAVVVIETSGATGPPPEGPRKAMVEMVKRHGSRLAGCSLVFEGDGFRASTVRMVVSGMLLATGGSTDTKVHRDGGEAAGWLSERLDGAVDVVDAAQGIAEIRRAAHAES